MALSPDILQQLQQHVASDQALAANLRTVNSPHAAARMLAETAARHGIAASGEDILAYFESQLAAHRAELSDAQLDAVAGGFSTADWILYSVCGFGIGCVYLSVGAAIVEAGSCK